MFTPEQREALRVELLGRANNDPHISAANARLKQVNNLQRWYDAR
jgi:hypothetical protein